MTDKSTPTLGNPPLPQVSYTSISTYMRCGWLWTKQYQEKLRSVKPSYNMAMGTLVHRILADAILRHANGGKLWVPTTAREIHDAYIAGFESHLSEEERNDLFTGIEIAHRALLDLNIDENWETVKHPDGSFLVEKELRWIDGGIEYISVVDWVAKNKHTGQIWLFDFKVRGSIQSSDTQETNVQFALYQWIMKKQGIDVLGTVTHQIRAALPQAPSVNKDGSISRTRIVTDWATYSKTVLERGKRIEEYADMQEKMSVFFSSSYYYRSEKEIDGFYQRVIRPVAVAIVATMNGHLVPYRSMTTLNCNGCNVRDLCLADVRGEVEEYKVLRETYFTSSDEVFVLEV